MNEIKPQIQPEMAATNSNRNLEEQNKPQIARTFGLKTKLYLKNQKLQTKNLDYISLTSTLVLNSSIYTQAGFNIDR